MCFCVREREYVCVSKRERVEAADLVKVLTSVVDLPPQKTSAPIERRKSDGGVRLSPATTTTTTSAKCSKRCEYQVRERVCVFAAKRVRGNVCVRKMGERERVKCKERDQEK